MIIRNTIYDKYNGVFLQVNCFYTYNFGGYYKMVIDCHYHLDERYISTENLLKTMDCGGIDKVALMATMVDKLPDPPKISIGILQFLLKNRPLRPMGRLLVANFDENGDIYVLGKAYKIYRDPDNEPVFETIKQYPDRFLGWVFVNPRGVNDPIKEIEKWQNSSGFIGIKVHPFWHRYSPTKLKTIAQKAVELKKPIISHMGFGSHGDFLPLVNEFPDLKLILAHAGFPRFKQTWESIKDRKNVYVDLSQTTYVSEKNMKAAVEYLGVERCIFGTDGPYCPIKPDGSYDMWVTKDIIDNTFTDNGVKRRLLGENFAELI